MKCNVGRSERGIRIVIGVALLGVALFHVVAGYLAVIAYVLAAIALITGAAGYCPAWALFGINTCTARRAGGGPAH